MWKRLEVPGNAREVTIIGLPNNIAWAHDKGLLIKTVNNKYVKNLNK